MWAIFFFFFFSFLFLGASCNYMRAHFALYSFWDHWHYGWMVLNCVYVAPFFLPLEPAAASALRFLFEKMSFLSLLVYWFFLFWFLQSRIVFSLTYPDRRATYVVEVLRRHLRHPIIIIKTLRFDWLGNKVSSELLLDITNLNLHLDLIISLIGNNKSSPTY